MRTAVLVTGASGFIGRSLVRGLGDAGYRVRAAVRQPVAALFSQHVEVVTLPDLMRNVDWQPLLAGIDIVVHLAGIAHTGPNISESTFDRVNRAATAEFSIAAAAAGIRRFVFISSIRAQTGATTRHILTEADHPNPTDPYGRSKLGAETAIRTSGVPFTIFRPVLVYGADVKGNFAKLLRLAASPLPLPFGALNNLRSLLALDNLIAAILFALKEPKTSNELFLTADPSPMTFAQVLTILREAQGRSPMLLPIPPAFIKAIFKAFGRDNLWERLGEAQVAASDKLLNAGWRPPITTTAGLAAMIHAAAPLKSGTASRSTP